MGASILITGHTGFVGTNLVKALQNDFVLYGLNITAGNASAEGECAAPGTGHSTEEPTTYGKNAGVKRQLLPHENTFSWDLMNELPQVNTIIHLAGKAHDTAVVSAPEEYFEVNLGLTKRIFDSFLQSNAKTFIFFSSVKAVADTVDDAVLTEEHSPDPKTPYGQSKLAAERYIQEALSKYASSKSPKEQGAESDKAGSAAETFSDEGTGKTKKPGEKRVYILRPCMIHGPGNKGNLNLLYNIVRKGVPWPLGAFHNQRSFLSINNLEYVIRQLIEKDIAPGIYQVADDEPVSTNELIGLMAQSLNRKPRSWNLPPGIIRGVARTGDLLRLPLNSERLKKLTETYVVSNKKIKIALGLGKMPVTATDGMIHTLKSFGG